MGTPASVATATAYIQNTNPANPSKDMVFMRLILIICIVVLALAKCTDKITDATEKKAFAC
jgi:lysylphosphatidylglycerol synthetase-like protein (DUF2156 family)